MAELAVCRRPVRVENLAAAPRFGRLSELVLQAGAAGPDSHGRDLHLVAAQALPSMRFAPEALGVRQ